MVAADGVHSLTRAAYADVFAPRVTTHRCRYIWLAADFAFDAFRFETAETEHGVMQLHGYPYTKNASTVIVEMREEVWRAAGLDRCGEAESTERCAAFFAGALGGRPLRSNSSSWTAFRTVVNDRWSHGNTVLLGDAAHTAHFSIGSGTKLAVEDALRTGRVRRGAARPAVRPGGVRERAPPRRRLHAARGPAAASLRWFEELGTYLDQPPRQFAFSLLTRSRRVTHDNLRLRDPAFTETVEDDFGCRPAHPRCSPPSGCAV